MRAEPHSEGRLVALRPLVNIDDEVLWPLGNRHADAVTDYRLPHPPSADVRANAVLRHAVFPCFCVVAVFAGHWPPPCFFAAASIPASTFPSPETLKSSACSSSDRTSATSISLSMLMSTVSLFAPNATKTRSLKTRLAGPLATISSHRNRYRSASLATSSGTRCALASASSARRRSASSTVSCHAATGMQIYPSCAQHFCSLISCPPLPAAGLRGCVAGVEWDCPNSGASPIAAGIEQGVLAVLVIGRHIPEGRLLRLNLR